jgi:hypothetical protein
LVAAKGFSATTGNFTGEVTIVNKGISAATGNFTTSLNVNVGGTNQIFQVSSLGVSINTSVSANGTVSANALATTGLLTAGAITVNGTVTVNTLIVDLGSSKQMRIGSTATITGVQLLALGNNDLAFTVQGANNKIIVESPLTCDTLVTFNGRVTFNSQVYFAGNATFNSDVTFNSKVKIVSDLKVSGNVRVFGSVTSPGADYSEYLEQLVVSDKLLPADIVGVYGGKVTRRTDNANRAMVITTTPFILGNSRIKDSGKQTAPIAFMGQVPVRVVGKVALGDLIVPSGKNDGTGIAIAPDEVSSDQLSLIVGQAWEASDIEAEKQVNVGILPADQSASILRIMESKNEALRRKNGELKAELDELRGAVDEIKKRLK